jgi:hypothetical protein
MSALKYGDAAARLVSQRVAAPETSIATLKQIPADKRAQGMVVQIMTGDARNTLWQYESTSATTGDDVLCITPSDAPSAGRWMRMPGYALLRLPFAATTPTGTNLLTVPSNSILRLEDFAWGGVSLVFTGAANCGVAVSSSNHPTHTGVGAFLPSAVATNLNNWFSGTANGTGIPFNMGLVASGTFDTHNNKRPWMKGGDTIRLDVIGAQFGTGIGAVLVACNVLQNPGT